MSIAIDRHASDGVQRLRLRGELDIEAVVAFEEHVCGCASAATRAIVIDLSGVGFMDSSGLWAITSALRWCEQRGYTLTLVPAPEAVQALFDVTGLGDVLPFVREDPDGETAGARATRVDGAPARLTRRPARVAGRRDAAGLGPGLTLYG